MFRLRGRSVSKLVGGAFFVACLAWTISGQVSKDVVEQVKCEVCELAVDEAVAHTAKLAEKDEDSVAELVDGLCTTKKKEGKWTAMYDIVREMADGPLSLKKQSTIGKCKSECISIQRACTAVLRNREETIVSLLLNGKGAAEIKSKVCKKTCSKKPMPLTNWVDEPFWPRDLKEVEAEERVEKMQAETGQKFKMWSREEIASMSQADIELEAAKDALGAQRREAKLAQEAEATGPRAVREL